MAQRQRNGLIIRGSQVRILLGPPLHSFHGLVARILRISLTWRARFRTVTYRPRGALYHIAILLRKGYINAPVMDHYIAGDACRRAARSEWRIWPRFCADDSASGKRVQHQCALALL